VLPEGLCAGWLLRTGQGSPRCSSGCSHPGSDRGPQDDLISSYAVCGAEWRVSESENRSFQPAGT
jgi:hypothetical protein